MKQAWIGDRTEVIDCHGKSVIPGLGDAHMHLAHAAKKFGTCSFGNIVPDPEKDTPEGVIKQLQDTLKAYVDEHRDAKVIRGLGWDRTWFSGGLQGIVRPFTRHDVDVIVPDRPAVLMSYCGHRVLLNTKALEAAGITKDTDDQNGLIVREADGNPSGYIKEPAVYLPIIASNQPAWFNDNPTEEPIMVADWGEDVVRQTDPSKSLIDNGVVCAYGSDFFVSPSYGLAGIQVAMTRRHVKLDPTYEMYKDLPAALPEECVSLREALQAHTINAAYQAHLEAITGSIEVGKSAELAVLDSDIESIPVEQIQDIQVLETVFSGKTVFRKND